MRVSLPSNNMPDPSAWVKKYLMAASVSWWACLWSIKGTKERRLISRPIHANSHCGLEIQINDPDISVIINMVDEGKRVSIDVVW